MSALGEYVHLYYSNYQKYGVTRKTENSATYNSVMHNYINSINDRIERIHKVDPKIIAQLKSRLKANTAQNTNKQQSEWAKHQQELIDQIYTLLYERTQNLGSINRVKKIASGTAWTTRNNKAVPLSTTANWATNLSYEELIERRKKANLLNKEIQQLITEINNEQPQSQIKIQNLRSKYQQYSKLSGNSTGSTLGEIQTAIGESRYKGTASNIGGNFGEMVVATCDDRAETLAQEKVAQFLQETVQGDKSTQILVDKSLISGNRGDYFLNTSTKDGTKYSLGSTKNKVDVQIQVLDQDLFVSVKSYTFTKDEKPRVDLQTVNLFTTILFLNSYLEDFGNHWLNMHTSHPGKRKGIVVNQENADEIVKKEVALQALSSGNPFKVGINMADTFVFMNRATGDVFIESIRNILENEEKFSRIGGLDKISSIYLNNHKSQKIQDRIANVLSQLHQKNISVAFNISYT